MTALEQMDNLYERLLRVSYSSSRCKICSLMIELMEQYPEVNKVWSYDGGKRLIVKRFTKNENVSPAYFCHENPAEIPQGRVGGLYLFGQTAFNPITRTPLFFIKVGQASCFKDRCKQYKTHNPAIWRIEFMEIPQQRKNSTEIFCHAMLESNGLHHKSENSTEWYEVSEELYTEICEKGFSYFFN